MSSIRIYRNTRFDAPEKWTDPPELYIRLEEGTARAVVVIPATADTGADLRALADQADAAWADYSAFLDNKEVRP